MINQPDRPNQPDLPPPLVGPDFSSYRADEVTWLLTDLSGVSLEAPVEQREAAIQSGRAHYAESLPVEYQPGPEYLELFHATLTESADRVAHAVGLVTERVLASRTEPVLVSLARAGTPIGILMRRWASFAHGRELPHYTISIVRGRGIDQVALRYLAEHHDPAQVIFIDGWTGKGAICRELAEALPGAPPGFSPDLAVLADPGRCVSLFGTRDDYLIPSACLNSTVSGLVSRTVLNDRLLTPGQFHGAKFYRELAAADVSAVFLDSISGRFPAVAGAVRAAVAAAQARTGGPAGSGSTGTGSTGTDWPAAAAPDWSGWRSAEALRDRYRLPHVNLVKPGVGETTRVLLRRVPWLVLIRPDARDDVKHVLLLAEQRGVPVVEEPGLPYSCVGLIKPTGTDPGGADPA